MKAAIFNAHGSSSNLEIAEVNKPVPRQDEILIEVKACALNRLDIWTRNGSPHLKIPLPHIGGSDISGVVIETGSDVVSVGIGDRVMINAGISCRKCNQCRRGQQSLCDKFSMIGEHHWGGLAEYVIVPSTNVIKIPNNIDFVPAAAMGLTLMTAYRMLVSRGEICDDNLVLIIGATGGVGTAALQLSKHYHAKTICLAGTDEKAEKLRKIGADHVINYKTISQWSKEVYQISKEYNRRGVDIVIDSVGELVFEQGVRSLAKGGKFITCGTTSGTRGNLHLSILFWKQLEIIGSTMASDDEFKSAMQLFFDGHISPEIDSIFTIDGIKKAHDRLESGNHFGKIVITL